MKLVVPAQFFIYFILGSLINIICLNLIEKKSDFMIQFMEILYLYTGLTLCKMDFFLELIYYKRVSYTNTKFILF